MHHVAMFNVNIGQTANTVLTAQTDGILAIDSAGNFLPQDQLQLIGAYAGSATMTLARLITPQYRQIALPAVRPHNQSLLPPNNPAFMDMWQNPLTIPRNSPLSADATSGLAMGNEQTFLAMLLMNQFVQMGVGDVYTLRATGTTTLTARAWSQVALTFDQSIIQGRYAVVGGDVISATGIAWRLTLDNQFYRPGGLAFANTGLRAPPRQYMGGWGIWGYFNNTSMPRLEVYANAADTAQTLFLQVIKLPG